MAKKVVKVVKKTKVVKKVKPTTKAKPKVDFGDDDPIEPVDELDDVPDLYDIDAGVLKERYEYKPVIRKEVVYLTADNRRTSEIMTQFEYTEIIGQRAKQIENGGPCFTSTTGMSDPIKMAEKELRDRKCPLDIIRQISMFVAERWHANEMGFVAV